MHYTEERLRTLNSTVTRLEVLPGAGLSAVRRELGPLRESEVEIAPRYSFISAGTELSAIRFVSSQAPGAHNPFALGYSQCGVVTRVGCGVTHVAPGDRVVAIGAGAFHAQRTVVAKNLVAALPDGVGADVVAAMAMYCFALEGVRKMQARIGENAVVFGAGMMGQITARLLALAGCRVCVTDIAEYRLGFLPPSIPGFSASDEGWARLREWSRPYGVEHASICFGGDATETIQRLKPLMSVSPDGVPHGRIVFPGGAYMTVLMASNMGNIQFLSSSKAGPGYRDAEYEAGGNYPETYVSHTVRRNVEILLELIRDGRLGDLSTLFAHRFPLSEAARAYEFLQEPGSTAMGVLLDYAEELAG